MKKRLLSALIALALVVTLVGCTNQQTTPDAGATTPGTQEEPQKDPVQTPSTVSYTHLSNQSNKCSCG